MFDKIRDEFPRESYQIITKIGRYGRTKADFDYSATRTRKSVENSMRLMKTDYLDGVYAHDVEFVSEQIGGAGQEGFTVDEQGKIRPEDLVRWGLEDKDAGTIRGPGDEKILEAFGELFKLKKDGKIRAVGFSGQSFLLLRPRFLRDLPSRFVLNACGVTTGYPLPTLLRIARLIAHHLEPIDIMQSYCHHTVSRCLLRKSELANPNADRVATLPPAAATTSCKTSPCASSTPSLSKPASSRSSSPRLSRWASCAAPLRPNGTRSRPPAGPPPPKRSSSASARVANSPTSRSATVSRVSNRARRPRGGTRRALSDSVRRKKCTKR